MILKESPNFAPESNTVPFIHVAITGVDVSSVGAKEKRRLRKAGS